MKRISGLWYHQDSEGFAFIPLSMRDTGRKLRVYFDVKTSTEAPDASLYVKGEDGLFHRVTGLWFKETPKLKKKYLFLELKEGNFRVYVNEFKSTDQQPDYVLYQLTDAQGVPLESDKKPDTIVIGAHGEHLTQDQGQEEMIF